MGWGGEEGVGVAYPENGPEYALSKNKVFGKYTTDNYSFRKHTFGKYTFIISRKYDLGKLI